MSQFAKSAKAIFLAALELPGLEERAAYVDHACGSDAGLRRRVEALLAANDEPDSRLDKPPAASATEIFQPIAEGPGTVIGPYKLLQQIGEGGFGVVYMAEQSEPVRRKVALKIIKPGMDTREVVARFESERQALALMDHPNIARVLDAGATESGRPFFVMELVKGLPITEFCDKNRLPVEERLRLFVDICRAVQHAHQKGVIHRDIKPSNVMVTLHDGRPVPKVIDFGVAKATSQQLTQKTLFTAYGQMIGTPVYMSPEQAEMSGLDIDTRSDIYSLGVLLYELLTGTTPLHTQRLRDAGFAEMQRMIREEEAPRPSMRLSTLGEQATAMAGNRSTDVRKLGQFLNGDLDWIVMKSLEKDRSRRYDTPNAFAADVERFLEHEAIVARPPTAAYRLRKFCRRNRALVASAAAITVALFLGMIASTAFGLHALAQRDRAKVAERDLENSLKSMRQERDRASAAQRREAKERRAAEAARLAERDQRTAAERERNTAEKLRNDAVALNIQLQQSNQEQRRAIYASEMNLVRIEAQRGNLQRMREILMQQLPTSGEEDQRGFEWNYWYRYLNQARVLHRIPGFEYGGEWASAIVPGGRFVAFSHNGRVTLQEVETGKTVQTFAGSLALLVNRTRFAASGRYVSGNCHAISAYWPLSSGPMRAESCTVFDPSGEPRAFQYPKNSFSHVSFLNISGDGKRIAVLGNDISHTRGKPAARLIVWDVDRQEVVLNTVQPRELNRVEFNGDGSRVAIHLCHGTKRLSDEIRDVAVVLDCETGQETAVARHNDDIDAVFWLPDGNRLLLSTLSYSGANRKDLLTWTIGPNAPQRLGVEEMPNYVKGAVSPDGRWLAVGGHTVSHIRLIDTERGNVARVLHNEATTIDTLTFSEDGRRIVACATSGDTVCWDLNQDDLFHLRSRPLPQLANVGYALSEDQTLLAVATATGGLLVRSREGGETVLRESGPGAVGGMCKLLLSGDNRRLARYDASPSNHGGGFVLEMYDLRASRRLWRIASNDRNAAHQSWAFTSDHQRLAFCDSRETMLIDCTSGECKIVSPSPGPSGSIVRLRGNGRLAQWVRKFRPEGGSDYLLDVISGETLRAAAQPPDSPRSLFTSQLEASPDGEHAAMLLGREGPMEVWNTRDGNRVFRADGDQVLFSATGERAAVMRREAYRQLGQTGDLFAIHGVSVWEVPSGRLLCDITLAGDRADAVRLSPNGQRLLTLHGKRALGSGGATAQGRLWDIASGREILAIPVADVNVYQWDLVFDATGNRLTSLLFGKSVGTGGGGASFVYEAQPLAPQEDAQLIARRLIDELSRETPLPEQMIAAIESRPGLNPLARDLAAATLRQMAPSPDRLAAYSLKMVGSGERQRAAAEYEKALRWTTALRELEPTSLRSRALLAAAQLRSGMPKDALATLADTANEAATADGDELSPYFLLAMAVEVLSLDALGKSTESLSLSSRLQEELRTRALRTSTANSTVEFSDMMPIVLEATVKARQAGAGDFGRELTGNNVLHAIDQAFRRFDRNGDGRVTSDEAPSDIVLFDVDRNNSLSEAELETGLKAYLLISEAQQATDQAVALGKVNEAVEIAPRLPLARNARAWLRATSSDSAIRDGALAVEDATQACQMTDWRNGSFLDTLAAALAATGEFEQAVKRQEQAMLLASGGTYGDAASRLALYRQGKPYHQPPQPTAPAIRSDVAAPRVERFTPPLLSPDAVARSRRIAGWTGSWSPDSKRLVRNVDFANMDKSPLEIIDLTTGETTLLCNGGVDPCWSPLPDGPIAFVRRRTAGDQNLSQEEVWLAAPDGGGMRKLCDGGYPSWSGDGRLFLRTISDDQSLAIVSLRLEEPDKPIWSKPLDASYPAVSPNGEMAAYVAGDRLIVRTLASDQELLSAPLQTAEYGLANWSPDGRYVVYGCWTANFPGLWLYEVATGKKRLLADLFLTRPRWSPDGKFIAADRHDTNQIVLLDISSLDLANGLPPEEVETPSPPVESP